MRRDFDVIVVGGGGAGLAAAITAKRYGASCMVLEADRKLGGVTQLSTGVVYAAETSIQRLSGIADTAQAMYDYIMTLNQYSLNPRLTRILSEGSGPAVEWLIGLGVEFVPEWLVCSGVDTVPRGHPTRSGVAQALVNHADAAGVETACNTRVQDLVVEDSRVVGVRAAGMELRAPAVVLTTGGFGNNPALVKRFLPTISANGDDFVFAIYMHAPTILGDGLLMAERIGANIVGQDWALAQVTAGFGHFIEAYMAPWAMMVNKRGRRFVAEYSPYAVFGYTINEQPGQRAWVIFDEPTLREGGNDLSFADPYNSGGVVTSWDEATIRKQINAGKITSSDNLLGLAAQIEIDGVALAATVERYNQDCAFGEDREFFKKAPKLFPIKQAPFYAIEVRGGVIGPTSTGVEIDQNAAALDVHGRPIPGLYAAGEAAGGILGRRYPGGGISITNAIVFGRIAGESAAKAANRTR